MIVCVLLFDIDCFHHIHRWYVRKTPSIEVVKKIKGKGLTSVYTLNRRGDFGDNQILCRN